MKLNNTREINKKFQPMSPMSIDSGAKKIVSYKDMYGSKNLKSSNRDKNGKRNRTSDNLNNRSNYHSVSTENSKSSDMKNSSSRNENNIYTTNKHSYFKSAMTEWKDKCFKLQKDNDSIRTNLILEKKKVLELEKRLKLNDKKAYQFDDTSDKLTKVVADNDNLQNQYEQSEMIRKEQTKLIKSLQYEIEILRKYTDINEFTEKTQENNTESHDVKSPVAKKKPKKKKKKSVEPTAKLTSKTLKK